MQHITNSVEEVVRRLNPNVTWSCILPKTTIYKELYSSLPILQDPILRNEVEAEPTSSAISHSENRHRHHQMAQAQLTQMQVPHETQDKQGSPQEDTQDNRAIPHQATSEKSNATRFI